MEVAIDNPSLLKNLSDELNYRLALTLNSLVQLTADTAVSTDSSVNVQLLASSFLSANVIRTVTQQLAGINARPLTPDGYFGGIMHPFIVHDVMNDASNNGLTDIIKRNESTVDKLFKPLSNDDVLEFAGVKFKQTTTAPTATINSQTYYNTYIFAKDAIFSIFLGKNPQTGEKNYKINMQEAPKQGSPSDPVGVIGGWVSYNVKYTNALRPGTVMTLRRVQSETSAS